MKRWIPSTTGFLAAAAFHALLAVALSWFLDPGPVRTGAVAIVIVVAMIEVVAVLARGSD